jgi:hypothetical protein
MFLSFRETAFQKVFMNMARILIHIGLFSNQLFLRFSMRHDMRFATFHFSG